MSGPVPLHGYLDRAAADHPGRTAVIDTDGRRICYRDLAALSDRVRDRLRASGVGPGDRVGIYLRKSIDSVAAIYGILKSGAAYVPVDPGAPPSRNAYILDDCAVRAVIVEGRFLDGLRGASSRSDEACAFIRIDEVGGGEGLSAVLDREQAGSPAPAVPSAEPSPEDLAYILYTSGSTGRPKGVMLSHGHAVNYIDWCVETFRPTPEDRFSSHAPFHFDLSILDLHTALRSGASLALIGEAAGKDPATTAELIADRGITIWYSTPSVLSLLVQFGRLEERDGIELRIVLFAGEVFPIKFLRRLRRILPRPVFYNLYGPTETNVCTFYRIPDRIPEERVDPYPIGRPCANARTRVVDAEGNDVPPGEPGELCVAGPPVMSGYWNLPEQTERAFLTDASGERWYRTGDIVVEEPGGDYVYAGRRDRMVKRRGYRVELGEIESALYRHPRVKEAAVVALPDEESGVRVRAFLACDGEAPSIIEMKSFCAEHLPLYMVPDVFSVLDELPKTSTDKMDYQTLKEME
jgi:amino acid adenylation domain-containing protein